MAKQTFTTGSVLTAAQMTSLQQTAMLGGAASAKTANYTLVAADAGTVITMSNAGATTITVNTGLFAAGDTVTILNIGAGTCTITAGTATVAKPTNATLALVTNAGGVLYFTATGASTFMPFDVGASTSTDTYTLINTPSGTALTGATTVNVTGISTYNKLLIRIDGVSSVNTSATITIEPNASASGCVYSGFYYDGTNSTIVQSSGSGFIVGVLGTSATQTINYYANILAASGATIKPYWGQGSSISNAQSYIINGYRSTTDAITSIQVRSSSGNLDAGTIYIYGAN